MTTGAQAIVKTLAEAGVRRVYGVPGEHCLDLVDEIHRRAEMEFVATRHEGAAAYMAEAEGKLTGAPGVCIGTAAVGAANLSIGVHTARQDSTPLIALVGQVSTRWRYREAWQEADLTAMFQPLAKASLEIPRANRAAELTGRAVQIALSDRPGPVVLTIPEDVQSEPSENSSVLVPKVPSSALGTRAVQEINQLLDYAAHPVIIVGGGTKNYAASAELSYIAGRTGAKVVAGFRRHDSYPNDDPHFAGTVSLKTQPAVQQAMHNADVVLVLGTRLSELTTLRYRFPSSKQTVIHIDPSPEVLSRSTATTNYAYVADPVQAIEDLAAARDFVLNTTSGDDQSSAAAEDEGSPVGAAPLETVAWHLNQLLDDDAVITSDAGDFYLPFARGICYTGARRYLGPTSGAMGYALPAAIAVAKSRPGREVVALAGDGGLMMTIQELETAVRLEVQLTVVVVNNSSYGSIRRHQNVDYRGRLCGVEFGEVSFAAMAEAMGAHGVTVTVEDFHGAYTHARQRETPTLLELNFSPDALTR
ncbi:thiamine pyrophosphate-binding protein [Nesterenkonia ebinurensis]|uniref:thiamine pyrophosphate-binding protein n=1 Tax=Nesterenkonia ebinurensis TaxID=2608252 RepID=UPI00123D9721|nr:thiamine pyrophosphate-dependent enzyme [Nesterenkonia ebinurensis]